MSINDSILSLAGLKDKNITFDFNRDGGFIEITYRGHDKHQVNLFRAHLDTCPEHCPGCGFALENNVYRNGTDTGEFALPSTNGHCNVVQLTKQRFQCRKCNNTFSACSPDFPERTKISRALSLQMFDLARFDLSEKMIAYILHLSHSKVHKMIAQAAAEYRTDYTRQLPAAISVDEFKYKAHQYAFEMIDADTSELIEVFPDRRSYNLKKYLSNYSLANRQRVELVITDMNANYQAPLHQLFPNAKIMIDRFNIVQLDMKAVQSERIKAQNSYPDRHNWGYRLLKANWQYFLTDRTKLNLNQSHYFRGINEYMYPIDAFKLIFDRFPAFAKTYDIYQEVLHAADTQDFKVIEQVIKDFTPIHSEVDKVIKTYKTYLEEIKLSFNDHHSNGRVEGINRRIKQIGRTAYGFRNSINYFYRIRFQLKNAAGLTRQFLNSWH